MELVYATTMAASDDLMKQVLAMSRRERVALMSALLKTLEDEPDDPNAEQLWAKEIRRRMDELATGAVKSVSWEEARSSLIREEFELPKSLRPVFQRG